MLVLGVGVLIPSRRRRRGAVRQVNLSRARRARSAPLAAGGSVTRTAPATHGSTPRPPEAREWPPTPAVLNGLGEQGAYATVSRAPTGASPSLEGLVETGTCS
ncbi:hypothetical protein GCM10023324_21530 [Streptomyces youssoufiensis]